MTRRMALQLGLMVVMSLLAACGGENDDTPLPTLFNPAAVTQPEPTAAAINTAPPTADAAAQAASPTATDTLTPTPTITASPTVLTGAQIEATGLAETLTADARVLPFTQTVEAIRQATATAIAGFSPTPSWTPAPTRTSAPTLEPESYQIVFYTNRSGSDDLYLMTLNGDQRALVRSTANEREPSCSPDGQSVVYASDASGSYQIYRLALNSTQPVQLTNTTGMNFAPIFNADGSRIAFVSTRNGGIPTIWIMNADGSNPQQVTTDLGRDTSPSWGPDGRQLLFSSDQLGPWDLFMTILEEEVEGEFPILPPGFNPSNQLWPVFDDQGERIAYTLWADLEDPQTADIYLLDFEQEAPLPVRAGPGADIAWAWGDETRLLASVGGPDDVQIALVSVDTGEVTRLTNEGPFNGGARLCTVRPGLLPPEPSPPPSPTPTGTPTATATFTPTPTPTTAAPVSRGLDETQQQPHIVQPGETLMLIGKRYGVNWREVAALNALVNPDRLKVGQRLTIAYIRAAWPLGGPRPAGFDAAIAPSPIKQIVVELGPQRVSAYENGRLVKTVTVSTGLPATPTIEGEFSIYTKRESQTMTGPNYYLPNVPYVMYFYQGYGLHGTYWHKNFGEPMSHGCVNLPTPDAKWFYDWAEIGTTVLVKK